MFVFEDVSNNYPEGWVVMEKDFTRITSKKDELAGMFLATTCVLNELFKMLVKECDK